MTDLGLDPWWWLLLALLAVSLLTSLLRVWIRSRPPAEDALESGLSADALPPLPIEAASVAARHPLPDPLLAPRYEAGEALHAAPQDARAVVPAPASPPLDRLTGLPGRLLLEDQLAAAAQRAELRQRRLALLCIDLDGFQAINETFGRSVADAVLREVAGRLLKLGRSTDTFARVGPDEFVMLMDGDPDSASATLVADRIRQSLQRPCFVQGREIGLSCSIGIVLYPDHGTRSRLIARADAAMLAAKRAGGNMHCFFDAGMDHDSQDVIDLHRDLRSAVESGVGLSLHYQPKLDSRSGRVTGVEALLRWDHPERGMISPTVFVPVAERFGLIGAMGQWVIDDACRQLKAWREAGLDLCVAINLSVHQLRQSDFVDRVQVALAHHGVSPDRLVFEVTESAAMEDPQASLRLFERLATLGASLSIDDFGTGYSSLSYLRKLPATELKIDRSLVQDVDRVEDAQSIVRAVIQLSHALNLRVIGEGVETAAQQQALRRMGCDELQGFLFAHPMPAAELQAWLQAASSNQA